jgi:hypothetical protein
MSDLQLKNNSPAWGNPLARALRLRNTSGAIAITRASDHLAPALNVLGLLDPSELPQEKTQ